MSVLYFIEILKYYLAYEFLYGEKLKKYFLPVAGFAVSLIMMFIMIHGKEALLFLLMYFFVLCVVAAVQRGTLSERIKRLIFLLFFLSCSDEFFHILLSLFIAEKSGEVGWETLLESSLTLAAVLILSMLRKCGKQKEGGRLIRFFGRHIMLIAIIMLLEIIISVTCLNYAGRYVDKPGFREVVSVLCLFSYFGIELLGFFLLHIRKVNLKMEKIIEDEKLLQDMERQYYEALLKRDEDTRRYRHDMANHLLCLNKYAEEGDCVAIKRYLSDMDREMKKIQKSSCHSGNDVLDVITDNYIGMVPSQTEVRISGTILAQLDEMKLCTIYGNLLQNAIEELQLCEDISILEIQFEQGEHFCRISICNSLSAASRKKTRGRSLKTNKYDKRIHGFGILNARAAVEELNGTLELNKTDDHFLAVVVLPL